jgi:glycosyltransferase involved in cell wall biosynthesis
MALSVTSSKVILTNGKRFMEQEDMKGDEVKIIQVCPRFLPYIGGVEKHVYEISKRLAKKHKVVVYTTDPSGELPKNEKVDGITIKRFRSFAPSEAYFFSYGLFSSLKKESCDILHAHCFQAFPSILAIEAAKKSRIKKIIFTPHFHPNAGTMYRNFLRKFYDSCQKRTFLKSDKIICISEREKEILNNRFQIEQQKMSVIPNGIDIEKFRNLPDIKKTKNFKMLYVGRLEKYKRIHWILIALKRIIERNYDQKISLTIVGKGPFEKQLLKFCKKLKIDKFVIFKQSLTFDELLKEYCSCDIFLMPSEYEAFGITILEALACNKPVIVNRSIPMSNLFSKYGYLISNITDMENALMDFLHNGKHLSENFDLKCFDWNDITEQTLKVYEDV